MFFSVYKNEGLPTQERVVKMEDLHIIDLYWEKIEVQKNPLHLLLYISMFPQLIAGPIVRYATIADELDTAIQQGEAMLNSDDANDILAKAEQVAAVLASVQEQKDTIDAEPSTPDEPTDETGDCPLCGQNHDTKWVRVVHIVLWFLQNVLNIFKK